MHSKITRKTSGPVYKIEKTAKIAHARFSHGFGNMRAYKQTILNLRRMSSSAQQIVVTYAAKRSAVKMEEERNRHTPLADASDLVVGQIVDMMT